MKTVVVSTDTSGNFCNTFLTSRDTDSSVHSAKGGWRKKLRESAPAMTK